MVDKEKIVFNQFEGGEFDNWYFRLKMYLEKRGDNKWYNGELYCG